MPPLVESVSLQYYAMQPFYRCVLGARLPQIVGLQQAKRLLLLGDSISAPAALSMNLVTELVEDPLARSMALAKDLSERSKRSLCSIKQSLELATFPNIEAVYRSELDAASWCFADSHSNDAFHKFRNRKVTASVTTAVKPSTNTRDINGNESSGDTLVSLLIAAAELHNHKPFLRFGPVDVSYAKFTQDVAHLATGLQNAGIKPGDVVAGMMANSIEMARTWFATMWIGAIWAPLNVRPMILQ